MRNLRKLQRAAKKLMRIEKKSKYLSIMAITMMIFISKASVVFASSLDGNTIKNNLIDNYVKPVYIVIFLGLLVKDFIKKNLASILIIILVGGTVGVLVFEPEFIQNIINGIKNLIGA